MTDVKISELSNVASAQYSDDYFEISRNLGAEGYESRKIRYGDLLHSIQG